MSRKYLLDCSASGAKWDDDVQWPKILPLKFGQLISTGFSPNHSVSDGIRNVIRAYQSGQLDDVENAYNLRVMKNMNIEKLVN